VDKSPETREEESPKVDQTSKEFLAFLDVFWSFVVQERETTTENHKMAKLTGRIAEGLGVIDGALNGGSTKVTIKARLLDSFARKETKTKWVRPWLHQVKAYMET
jgi:hypothetical protein